MNLFGVTNVHEPAATEALEFTLTEWLREGLLQGGAFMNVGSGTAQGVLRESPRPGLAARTVYQTPRADWVWESGVAHAAPPVNASGVWVNGVFRPFGPTCLPDHPAGSVTFSTPLAAGASVVANYAARTVRVFNPRTAPWYQAGQTNSHDPAQAGSGTWSPDGRDRVQYPAVFVQALPRVRRFEGRELGSRGRVHRQDVLFEILAESPSDRDRLHDALVGQWCGRLVGVDLAATLRAGRMPLTYRGEVNPSGLGGYAALAAAFPWTQVRVGDVDSGPLDIAGDRPRLAAAAVRWLVELDLPA